MADSRDEPFHRFTDRAADYAKYRPGYPPAVITAILEGMGDPVGLLAADVGAGTGISSRVLADAGPRVLAIEPNAAMRSAATLHPRVEWREGTGEATGLEAEAVDLLLCAQAFHWFDQEVALHEFARVLRPGGRLALLWNKRDHRDPFTRGYRDAILDIGGEAPAEKWEFHPAMLNWADGFRPVRIQEEPNEQRLDADGLLGRALSASYVPKEGPGHEELVRRLRALHEAHADADGMAVLRYLTRAFLTDRL